MTLEALPLRGSVLRGTGTQGARSATLGFGMQPLRGKNQAKILHDVAFQGKDIASVKRICRVQREVSNSIMRLARAPLANS